MKACKYQLKKKLRWQIKPVWCAIVLNVSIYCVVCIMYKYTVFITIENIVKTLVSKTKVHILGVKREITLYE